MKKKAAKKKPAAKKIVAGFLNAVVADLAASGVNAVFTITPATPAEKSGSK